MISNAWTSGMPAPSMVASWRLNMAMSPALTLPPERVAVDCFLMRVAAMP